MEQPTSKRLLPLLLALMPSLLGACKSVGQDFATEHVPDLQLGETTEAEVIEWFGASYKVAEYREGVQTDIAYYRHAIGTIKGGEGRVLAVEFLGGVVNGWIFDSSMESDSTQFDASLRSQLEVGVTTGGDAQALFGPPTGRCALPSNLVGQHAAEPLPETAVEVWIWRHTVIDRNLVFLNSRTRLLALSFDAAGELRQIEYDGPTD